MQNCRLSLHGTFQAAQRRSDTPSNKSPTCAVLVPNKSVPTCEPANLQYVLYWCRPKGVPACESANLPPRAVLVPNKSVPTCEPANLRHVLYWCRTKVFRRASPQISTMCFIGAAQRRSDARVRKSPPCAVLVPNKSVPTREPANFPSWYFLKPNQRYLRPQEGTTRSEWDSRPRRLRLGLRASPGLYHLGSVGSLRAKTQASGRIPSGDRCSHLRHASACGPAGYSGDHPAQIPDCLCVSGAGRNREMRPKTKQALAMPSGCKRLFQSGIAPVWPLWSQTPPTGKSLHFRPPQSPFATASACFQHWRQIFQAGPGR